MFLLDDRIEIGVKVLPDPGESNRHLSADDDLPVNGLRGLPANIT
jgi:hypothetical protein